MPAVTTDPAHDASYLHVLYDNHPDRDPQTIFNWVPANPYPVQPPLPPQVAHKVWILDCKSCGTFLTNRGMKAVLLLRPNISLFSTDALPINCSAYTSNPDVVRGSACRPSASSAHSPPRTCECLTQTLCCHGCGTAVGYMIVIPCSRCTSSITVTNRPTNGHRFVFHSSEIVGTERRYIAGEPGVIPSPSPDILASAPLPPPFHPPPLAPSYYDSRIQYPVNHYPNYRSHSPPLPTPPLELAELSVQTALLPSPASSVSSDSSMPPLSPVSEPFSYTRRNVHYVHTRPHIYRPHSPPAIPQTHSDKDPQASSFQPEPLALRGGDVLYWYHLARTGEIPGVMEDDRARTVKHKSGKSTGARIEFDR